LRNGKEKKLNQNFLRGIETVAVYAAGPEVILGILNFAVYVLDSLHGKVFFPE